MTRPHPPGPLPVDVHRGGNGEIVVIWGAFNTSLRDAVVI